MVRRCWVNFQCWGVLLIWIIVGQGFTQPHRISRPPQGGIAANSKNNLLSPDLVGVFFGLTAL